MFKSYYSKISSNSLISTFAPLRRLSRAVMTLAKVFLLIGYFVIRKTTRSMNNPGIKVKLLLTHVRAVSG